MKFNEFIFMWLHETHVSKHFVCTLKNVSLDTRLEMEDSCSLPGIHLQNVYITHGENLLKVSVISQTKSTLTVILAGEINFKMGINCILSCVTGHGMSCLLLYFFTFYPVGCKCTLQ